MLDDRRNLGLFWKNWDYSYFIDILILVFVYLRFFLKGFVLFIVLFGKVILGLLG